MKFENVVWWIFIVLVVVLFSVGFALILQYDPLVSDTVVEQSDDILALDQAVACFRGCGYMTDSRYNLSTENNSCVRKAQYFLCIDACELRYTGTNVATYQGDCLPWEAKK